MGRIVDGRVSGKLPEHVAFAINYPGYPSSLASAIKTLGGDEGLAKARTSELNFLELKFRPDDPFAHPAFGELRRSSDLVLRLKKKARQTSGSLATSMPVKSNQQIVESDQSRQSSDEVDLTVVSNASEGFEGQAEEVDAEIIAKVEHTYEFDGMADYQYVTAVHASASNTHKRKGLEESFVKDGRLLEMEPGEMMMLVPPLFSVKDIPEEIFLRPPGGKKKKQLLNTDGDELQAPCFSLDFKIKEVPKEGNWELKLVRGSEQWLRTAALVRLFQERPIWTKSMLNERLMEQGILVTEYYLRGLLFKIAYYFGCGPFRNLWIRNGYDPRLDSESRAFQMIDFRVPTVLREEAAAPSTAQRKWSFSDMCAFKSMPQKKFTQFQLIDLQDDDIQAQIESPPERSTCSQFTGWFRLRTINRLRQIIRMRFLALFPGDIARALESAERKSFDRSRSVGETEEETGPSDAHVQLALESGQIDAYRAVEEDIESTTLPLLSFQGQLNGVDLNANEEEEEEDEDIEEDVDLLDEGGLKTNEDEDEDEDEEEEEEEEPEEEPEEERVEDMEDQQSHDGIVEVEDSLNMHEYIDPTDNIPKNYMQALLGKFAFNDNVNEPSSAVDFDEDGQYTIYEQDEDEDEDD